MKKLTIGLLIVVLCMVGVAGGQGIPPAMAQGSADCNADQVVATFAQAVASGTQQQWLDTYTQGNCPEAVKEGARAMLQAYLKMGGPAANVCEELGAVCELFAAPEQSRDADFFVWVNEPGSLEDSFNSDCAHSGEYGLNLVYGFTGNGNGGFGVTFEPTAAGVLDTSGFSKLTFWVRGMAGQEEFQIGLRDKGTAAGREPKYESKKIMPVSASKWVKMTVSLDKFPNLKRNAVLNLTFGFNANHDSGSLCIDDVAFE